MLLNIITCCIRVENLPRILDSYNLANNPKISVVWYVVLDNNVLKYTKEQVEEIRSKLKLPPEIKLEMFIFSEPLTHNSPINCALEQIKTGLVCLIDDDNIMHPEFIDEIHQLSKNKNQLGIIYQQNMGREYRSYNRHIRNVLPHLILPGYVDTAQITISRELIGSYRWPKLPAGSLAYDKIINKSNHPQGTAYQPDGEFISTLYEKHKENFYIINKPLCYYNYLSSNLDFS